MEGKIAFEDKEDREKVVYIAPDEIAEIIPDANMLFSLVTLKNGSKHFVCGTTQEVHQKLGLIGEDSDTP